MADAAGLTKKEEFGPIIEQGKMFGFGWIPRESMTQSFTQEGLVL